MTKQMDNYDEKSQKGAFVSVLLVGAFIALLYVAIFWLYMARV